MEIGMCGPFKVYATGALIGLDSEDREKTLTPEQAINLANCLRGWGKVAKEFKKLRANPK